MDTHQVNNCLNWAEAMLSGKFRHGKGRLYDYETDCHCALAVAAEQAGVPRLGGNYIFSGYGVVSNLYVPTRWFNEAFGLPREMTVYQSVSDNSSNYLAVASLILNNCPLSDRKRKLMKELERQALAYQTRLAEERKE